MTKLIRSFTNLQNNQKPVIASLGKFDGLHLGHQEILRKLKEEKTEKNLSLLISFYPNPANILNPLAKVPVISSLKQRLRIFNEYAIDYYLLLRFDYKFSRITAEEFVQKILFRDLKVNHLVIGEDAAVGYQRKGTVKFIKDEFEQAKKIIEVVSFNEYQRSKISTNWLRQALFSGDLETFKKLSGRNYIFDSKIIAGDGRGHQLGFPTANLKNTGQLLPFSGIYATRAYIDGEMINSVSSVGVRPTFNGKDKIIEVHLIDFPDKNVYGKRIELEFVRLLRTELKYDQVSDLIRQIRLDIENAKEVLEHEHI